MLKISILRLPISSNPITSEHKQNRRGTDTAAVLLFACVVLCFVKGQYADLEGTVIVFRKGQLSGKRCAFSVRDRNNNGGVFQLIGAFRTGSKCTDCINIDRDLAAGELQLRIGAENLIGSVGAGEGLCAGGKRASDQAEEK